MVKYFKYNAETYSYIFTRFWAEKSARGMFTDIASVLSSEGIESVLFDYNDIDLENNIVTVKSLPEQAKILEKVIEETKQKNPGAVIDIIACSQGPLVVGLLKPLGIRKAVFIGASLGANVESMIKLFGSRPGSVVDLEGVSKFVRRDGSLTLVPANYWLNLENFKGLPLYNDLAEIMEVTLIRATKDEVLSSNDFTGLNSKAKLVDLEGNHDFNGEFRPKLLELVRSIICLN